MENSTDADIFHYGSFKVGLKHAIGYFLCVQRKIQGYTQVKFAALTNYSRTYCSRLEIGKFCLGSDLFSAYLKTLKLNQEDIFQFLKKVRRYIEQYFRSLKRYELIFQIASGKVIVNSKKLLQACRDCNRVTLYYLFIRFIFKVYGLKPVHLGVVSAKGIKEKKNKKGLREWQAFEKSVKQAKERYSQAQFFKGLKVWHLFNNSRCLFGKKLAAAQQQLRAEGLV